MVEEGGASQSFGSTAGLSQCDYVYRVRSKWMRSNARDKPERGRRNTRRETLVRYGYDLMQREND